MMVVNSFITCFKSINATNYTTYSASQMTGLKVTSKDFTPTITSTFCITGLKTTSKDVVKEEFKTQLIVYWSWFIIVFI